MTLENVQDIYPLSPMQSGMLFHAIEAREAGLYVLQIRVTLEGDPRPETLQQTWDEVVQRHEALRAAFVWEGLEEPLQVIHEQVLTPWTFLEADRLIADQGADAVTRWLDEDRRRGFDLTQAPLMRMAIIDHGDGTHRLVWTLHHLLSDAWSVAVVLQELQERYHARLRAQAPRGDPAPSYRDFIAWLRDRDLEQARDAWRRYLAGFDAPNALRFEESAEPITDGTRRLHESTVPGVVAGTLTELARLRRVTLTSIFHAAWALTLGRYTDGADIVFGSVVSGRGHGLPGAERAVGLYMNTIPARVRLDGAPTLGALIDTVHAAGLELRPVENTPLGRIRAWSDVSAGAPLFDSLFIVENHPPAAGNDRELVFRDVEPMDQSNYPLAVFLVPGDTLRLLALVDPAMVGDAAAERLLAQFVHTLEQLPEWLDRAPLALPTLPPDERQRLDALARGPALPAIPAGTILGRIADQARERPEAVALEFAGTTLSYEDLVARVTACAHGLVVRGIGRGDRVALLMDRGGDTVVAMLAVLAAGAAYVPLDPAYPEARIRQVLATCSPAAIIGASALTATTAGEDMEVVSLDDLGAGATPGAASLAGPDAEDLAYVMVTSGSTGTPKGVAVTHGNLLASTLARPEVYREAPAVFLLLSSFAFDSSVAGIYWTLATGGKLLISEPGLEKDAVGLAGVIAERGVTHTLCLPSLYDLVLEFAGPGQLGSLTTVIVAGETVPRGLLARHRAALPRTALYNEYGPTEATVWCTVCELTALEDDDATPIGRPVPGAEVRLLTDEQRLAPLGAVGEIWIGGPGVARGYFDQPEATEAAFTQPPVADGRLYRTGDLARHRPDGQLEFLGRRDGQVKIRGHRIETAEVESVLCEHADVEDAWVAPVSLDTGPESRKRAVLAAAIVPRDGAGSSIEDLKSHVRERLPAFMAPSLVAVIDRMPLLPNGKIDAASLSRTVIDAADAGPHDDPETAAPRDAFEADLAAIWSEVLGVDVSVLDDFFELGGDSLSSIRIVALAQRQGHRIAPSELFEYPSIRGLSAFRRRTAEALSDDGANDAAMPNRSDRDAPALFMVHGGRRILEGLRARFDGEREVVLLADHRDSGDVSPFASIGSLAAEYLTAIRERQAEPPRLLGGYSIGAPIAVEMARQLQARGAAPAVVFLLDPPDDPSRFASTVDFDPLPPSADRTSLDPRLRAPQPEPGSERGPGPFLSRWSDILAGTVCRLVGARVPLGARRRYVPWVYDRALRRHVQAPYAGPMLIFHSSDAMRDAEGRTLWERLEGEHADTVKFDARHTEFVRDPAVVEDWTARLAERLRTYDNDPADADAANTDDLDRHD